MKIQSFRQKYLGDKVFYASVVALVLPMIAQQGITQFVNLLDNVMVGRLGTEPMSGVAIVNQLIYIFNLTVFGGISGASIFGAQFFGKEDHKGLRDTFRFRLLAAAVICIVGVTVLLLFGEPLFRLYLKKDMSDPAALAATLEHAKAYLAVILWGLPPFALVQSYYSVLRNAGQTVIPMTASAIAIVVNLVLNYLLIFGNFGFPAMGVTGAALATVIARYVEVLYLLARVYWRRQKYPFLIGVFRGFRIPWSLARRILAIGTPLLLNEMLWSIGMAAVNMCYSFRGLNAVAATNINSTVWNLFAIVMISMGDAIGILIGQLLGAGAVDKAKASARKLLFLITALNLGMGLLIVACAPLIPHLYNTEAAVRQTATRLLMISGSFLPVTAYVNGTYFTIRSGGKTFITFLFDSGFNWVVCIPLAFLVCTLTDLSVVWVFFLVQCTDLIKATIGTIMIHSGIWANNVVNDP